MMDELASFALLTIPLFVLLGAAIGSSAAGKDIYESLHRWLDRVPGGLVIANILACGVFSAICGSSPATAAAIGKAGVPEMIQRGVSPAMATGLDLRRRHARHPDPAVDHDDPLRHRHRDVDRAAVPRRRRAGHPAGACCSRSTPGSRRLRRTARCAAGGDAPLHDEARRSRAWAGSRPSSASSSPSAMRCTAAWPRPSEVAALSAVLALVLVMVIYRAVAAGRPVADLPRHGARVDDDPDDHRRGGGLLLHDVAAVRDAVGGAVAGRPGPEPLGAARSRSTCSCWSPAASCRRWRSS